MALSAPARFSLSAADGPMRGSKSGVPVVFAACCPFCSSSHVKLASMDVGVTLTFTEYRCDDCGKPWTELTSGRHVVESGSEPEQITPETTKQPS
jgi:hypothetical protein